MTNQERIEQVKGFIKDLENRTDFAAELELTSLEAHLGELEGQQGGDQYRESNYMWATSVDMFRQTKAENQRLGGES